jgi:hypothetical protein
MSNREIEAGKSGFSLVGLVIAAFAVCAIAVLLMPAQATTDVSGESAATYAAAGDAAYLPAQIVNQGTETAQVVDLTY